MKNSGFYDNEGNFINVNDYGITIEQLCDYKTREELLVDKKDDLGLVYLILTNFHTRKSYLKKYLEYTNDSDEKEQIEKFLTDFNKNSKKRSHYIKVMNELQEFLETNPINDELKYSTIKDLYDSIAKAYSDMIDYDLEDCINQYIEGVYKLIDFYKKIYNYDLNLDPSFRNIIEHFQNAVKK